MPLISTDFCFLPPANELCEGYVFTPVCQSFCSEGDCLGSGGGWGVWRGGCLGPDLQGEVGGSGLGWVGVQAHIGGDPGQGLEGEYLSKAFPFGLMGCIPCMH